MNNMKKENKLKVYYDGLCILCSREIVHYQKQVGAERIEFIDICSAEFDAKSEGLDPFQVHKIMHVRKPDGSLATRVQAFIEIWERLPRYRKLASLAKIKIVNQGLEVGYSLFASIRPLLPRRKKSNDCSDSPYCEVKNG